MTETRTLHCVNGDHNWERPVKRGAIPENCPEHPNTPEQAQKKRSQSERARQGEERSTRSRERQIEEILALPKNARCRCGITPQTDREWIVKTEGCCYPHFICRTLDEVRRKAFKI